MNDSTVARSRRKAATKPKRVHKEFPLKVHNERGYWCKKVLGKVHYFGKVADDPKGAEALKKWLADKDDLLAGRTPRSKSDGLTVEDLCDHFLNAKKPLVASGELTQRMYDEYFATCERVVKAFGYKRLVDDLRPNDFDKIRASATAKWGLHRVAGEDQRVRTLCKYGLDAGHIDKPVRFGPLFKRPSMASFRNRKAKEAKGESLLSSAEVGLLLNAPAPNFGRWSCWASTAGLEMRTAGNFHSKHWT